ncbi:MULTISPECIES: hypothetical protein [Lactococcus]|uniref:Uncharacterized protein n=1 Tax=Lactococcus formosensis TaxID=1281486 RepID=A0A9X4P093_9LACT|nr:MULTISPECIES: hypothetical protein [Lactococcus]MDG6126416.1 hypothetical protein [Lactococcus formosensis]MDG6131896.1 hypothetical protein [Lactococcus formosensis]MDG6133893.1 hypothetical protein [Lactococcus formosensis]MDG6140481.1 hypothetical protein [Lactococcus formosensis]MDG6145023.1 hypothetical protein [Lactococcus formosensis]
MIVATQFIASNDSIVTAILDEQGKEVKWEIWGVRFPRVFTVLSDYLRYMTSIKEFNQC